MTTRILRLPKRMVIDKSIASHKGLPVHQVTVPYTGMDYEFMGHIIGVITMYDIDTSKRINLPGPHGHELDTKSYSLGKPKRDMLPEYPVEDCNAYYTLGLGVVVAKTEPPSRPARMQDKEWARIEDEFYKSLELEKGVLTHKLSELLKANMRNGKIFLPNQRDLVKPLKKNKLALGRAERRLYTFNRYSYIEG